MPKLVNETALTHRIAGTDIILSEKEELFCQYYCGKDGSDIGNGTQSAIKAGYNAKSNEVFRSIARENLTKPHILRRIRELLNTEVLTDEKVDCELAFVIEQKADLPSKMSGIKEYNRLKNRIKDSLVQIGEIKVQWGE